MTRNAPPFTALSGAFGSYMSSMSPPVQVAMLGVAGLLMWAGWKRGTRMELECEQRRICGVGRTALHTAGWSILAWPVGVGYLTGRITAK